MSLNIFVASKPAKPHQTGETFYGWDLPHQMCQHVLESKNPFSAYIGWVEILNKDETVPIWDMSGLSCGNTASEVKVFDEVKEHIDHFLQWLDNMRRNGYDIKCEIL